MSVRRLPFVLTLRQPNNWFPRMKTIRGIGMFCWILSERRLYGKKLKQSLKAPAGIGTSCHRTEWRAIYPKAYKVVCWGFPDEHRPFFACNGIRVMDPSKSFAYPCSWASAQIPFTLPSVSVIDEDGALPLTLQRYGLETSSYPFDKELAGDITKDFCAHILLHSPESPTHLFERPFTL